MFQCSENDLVIAIGRYRRMLANDRASCRKAVENYGRLIFARMQGLTKSQRATVLKQVNAN